jgi:hypothetical protein
VAFVRDEEDVLVGKPVDLFYKGFLCGYCGMLGNVVMLDYSTMFHILHISCKAADEPYKVTSQRSIERYTSCTLCAFLFSFRFQ